MVAVVARAGEGPTEVASVRVDAKALVTVRHNRYSVPVALAGLRADAAVRAREIVVSHRGREVARYAASSRSLPVRPVRPNRRCRWVTSTRA